MGRMSRGTNTDPVVGDVYRVAPETSVTGDKHGPNKRPAAVVETTRRAVQTLTRTTHPDKNARTLPSPKNDDLDLDQDAWWSDRNQRPLARSWLSEPAKCLYLGRLPEDETRALERFWDTTVSLGRKNL